MDQTARLASKSAQFYIGNWRVVPSTSILQHLRPGSQQKTKQTIEPRMMEVLCLLADARGSLVSRQELQEEIWRSNFVSDAAINRVIAQLRKVMGDSARNSTIIDTVPKKGYRLLLDVRFENDTAVARLRPPKIGKHIQKIGILCLAISILALVAITDKVDFKKSDIDSAVEVTNLIGSSADPAISDDQRYLAFTHTTERFGSSGIYVKDLQSQSYLRITSGRYHDYSPDWSSQGRSLLFIRLDGAQCQVRRHQIQWQTFSLGTESQIFQCKPGQALYDAAWAENEDSLYLALKPSSKEPAAIYRYHINDKRLTQLSTPPKTSRGYIQLWPSSDRKLLALIQDDWQKYTALVIDVNTGRQVQSFGLPDEPGSLSWSSDNRSLNVNAIDFIQRFNLENGRSQVVYRSDYPILDHSAFDDDTALTTFEIHGGDLGVMDLKSSTLGDESIVASDREYLMHPRISKHSNRLAYARFIMGKHAEIWIEPSAGEPAEKLAFIEDGIFLFDWSPDDRYLLATKDNSAITIDVASGHITTLTPEGWHITIPTWSHDGQSIFFSSNQTGQWQIWQLNLSDRSLVQVTKHGGWISAASSDGNSLFFSKKNEVGLWRRDLKSGLDTKLFDFTRKPFWVEIFPTEKGIYFVGLDQNVKSMMFYDFKSKQIKLAFHWPSHWGTQVSFNREFDQIVFENFGVIEGNIYSVKLRERSIFSHAFFKD